MTGRTNAGAGGGMKQAMGTVSGWTNNTTSDNTLSVTGLDFTPKLIILKWGNDSAAWAWDGVNDMDAASSWTIVMSVSSTYGGISGYAKPIAAISVGKGFVTAVFKNSNASSTNKYMLIGD